MHGEAMVLPQLINLREWSDSLRVDYPDDAIPELVDESNWHEWGDLLVQEESFFDNNAPGTAFYNDWQTWAQAVFFTMNNS